MTVLTSRFRSREGFLYTIHWHETGLEAYADEGQPEAAGSLGNCALALRYWIEKANELGEKD